MKNDDTEEFIEREEVRPVRLHLKCAKGCGGEMKSNGATWPNSPEGYHHTCDKYGEIVTIRGQRFPRISYEPASQGFKTAVNRVLRNPATSKAAKVRAGRGLTQRAK